VESTVRPSRPRPTGARTRRSVAIVAALTVALSACGGSGEDQVVTSDPVTTPATSEDLEMKPEFDVPNDEAPPSELIIEDRVVGDGETAEPGDTVDVHYVGKAWSTGEQFDASWDRGQPLSFELGAGRVIEGWDQGVAGMQVGGRRLLIIPPELAYGSAGAGGVIGPDETLVFVVDLIGVS
jgi:peptidylprolyl isomerase